MAEPGEVLDGEPDPDVVGRAHDVDPGGLGAPADGDDVVLLGESRELRVGQVRTEQEQRLAPEVEERLDGAALVPGAGQGADDDVVAALVGSGLEVLEELGVEAAANVHRDTEQLRAVTASRLAVRSAR